MDEAMTEIQNNICEHLEFTIAHGGFDLQGQGGCSCEICQFLCGYSMLQYYNITKKWFKSEVIGSCACWIKHAQAKPPWTCSCDCHNK